MARLRKPLAFKIEGATRVCRFLHPVLKRTVRIPLGETDSDAGSNLEHLNKAFLIEAHWTRPAPDCPEWLKTAWGYNGSVKVAGQDLPKDEKAQARIAALTSQLETAMATIRSLESDNRRLTKEAEHWKGSKIRQGPCPTLAEAKEKWLATFKNGKDAKHAETVDGNLAQFVKRFGAATPVDDMAGREREISSWLAGLDVSAGRQQQIRIYVLKLLCDSGVQMDRKAVPSVKLHKIREDRKAIHWLEKKQAEKLARKLPEFWRDLFKVQVGLGLRPDELLTLHRDNFTKHEAPLDTVTLSPLAHLTLKRGPRTLRVPEPVRKIIAKRLKQNAVVFADPATGMAWKKPDNYNRQFAYWLEKAAKKAKITTPMDCRIGRRTCGSLLLRAGLSTEQVAAQLGNSPQMVREHYARILPKEVDSSAAVLE